MSERFTRLFTLPSLYADGSPVIIQAGALLKDNSNGNILAQLKFKNVTGQIIKCLTVSIYTYDSAERLLESGHTFQYLDINAGRNYEFGSKVPVPLFNNTARSFGIRITEVIFDDKTVVDLSDRDFVLLPQKKPLIDVLKQSRIVDEYIAQTGASSYYVPEKFFDLNICSCGCVSKERFCLECGRDFNTLVNFCNYEKLSEILDERQKRRAEEQAIREEQQRIEQEKRKEKYRHRAKILRKIGIVAACVFLAVSLPAFLWFKVIYPSGQYNKAQEFLKQQDYQNAYSILAQIPDYKDSSGIIKQMVREHIKNTNSYSYLSAGGNNTVGLRSDGTVIAVDNNYYVKSDVLKWTDIVAVSAGSSHAIGLKSDGTVVAAGENYYGRCNVSGWKDIVAVSAGKYHTIGLKSDGTVVAKGDNSAGQCDVSEWADISAVSAGYYYTIGLKSDGTVVATGNNYNGQCNVVYWEDIVAVSAGKSYTVGLKSDGTVVAAGENYDGRCNVSGWKDIVAVSAGEYHTVGVKFDGTVVATGNNEYGQCDVSDWKDIVAVSAGSLYTVGLKSDGTVVAAGNNGHGQCDVSSWKLKTPSFDKQA